MDMNNLIKSVEKIDDYTVKFTLNQPEAPFLANLGMDFASIMSAEQADALMAAGTPELLDQQPVGTGPFQLVAYQKDAVIRYKANPDYREGKAAIEIGRAPCRERVCQYVEISVGAESLEKKIKNNII